MNKGPFVAFDLRDQEIDIESFINTLYLLGYDYSHLITKTEQDYGYFSGYIQKSYYTYVFKLMDGYTEHAEFTDVTLRYSSGERLEGLKKQMRDINFAYLYHTTYGQYSNESTSYIKFGSRASLALPKQGQ